MTAEQAIECAQSAFGERQVTITVAAGILRIESKTHHSVCAFAHELDGIPDELIVSEMLPTAVEAMDRAIASGKHPPRSC